MDSGVDTTWAWFSDALSAVGSQPVFGIASLTLAVVFVLSAIPKLRKPELAALAMVDFGVVARPRRWMGVALGAGELAVAVGLAVAAASSTASIRLLPMVLAALVLWVFVALLAKAMRSDEEFACFCFGGEDSAASPRTLLRTLALALLASVMVVGALEAGTSPSAKEWILELLIAASAIGALAVAAKIPMLLKVSA